MDKREDGAKVKFVGKGVIFVQAADGRLVRVEVKSEPVKERVYTSRVVGRD